MRPSLREPRRRALTRVVARVLVAALVVVSLPQPAAASFAATPLPVHIHADGIGSIRRLTNEAGTITDGYTYTAFGELLAHTGADPQPYSFAGEPLDPNSGFQYHRARWMDPNTGRFNGVDPFDGDTFAPLSLHRYAYANGSPVNHKDPTGRFTLVELGIAALLVVSLAAVAFHTYSHLTRPTYHITSDRVIKSPAGFYKLFQLQINSPQAKDDFELVQWVEGGFFRFGTPQLVCIRDQIVEYNFLSPTVDTCDKDPFIGSSPIEAGVKRFSGHIVYKDTPGRDEPIAPGEHYDAALRFVLHVYDKKRLPASAQFWHPEIAPRPLKAFSWSFVDSYYR